MLLYFIRHGDPCYNPDSLTPLGHRQAEAIGRRLSVHGIDKIYSSPMVRAMQTAQPAAELLTKEINVLDFASEQHAWDELTLINEKGNRTWACSHPATMDLFMTPEVRDMGMRWYDHPAFEGQTYKQGMERIARESDAFFASHGYERMEREGFYKAVRPNNDRIAIFAHAGFGVAFLSHVLGIPYPQYSQTFDMSHSSLTLVEFKDRNGIAIPTVVTLSNDAHLYHENLPTQFRAKF